MLRLAFLRRQLSLDKKITVLEQRSNLRLDSFIFANDRFFFFCHRTAAFRTFRFRLLQFTPNLGNGFQHRLVNFLLDVEFANWVSDAGKYGLNGFRVQRRTIGRDPVQNQTAA